MTLFVLWTHSGIIGMLMTTWAEAQEKPGSRNFTVGHLLAGIVIGPPMFIIGIISIAHYKKWEKYVAEFLSAKLFERRP